MCEQGTIACTVFDNASDDGTVDFVQHNFPYVHVIASPKNLGFGNACNQGAARVDAPYLLFLNPDAQMSGPGILALAEFMDEHERAGICAPFIFDHYVGGTHTPTQLILSSLKLKASDGRHVPRRGEPPFLTHWVCGAIFAVRASTFQQLGGFDPRFFMYFEETDLCDRTIALGQEVWMVPTIEGQHEGGASTKSSQMTVTPFGTVAKYYFQSRYYYLAKHHGPLSASLAELVAFVPLIKKELVSRLRGKDEGLSELRARLAAGILRFPPPVDQPRS